jgi:hypothetical protein
MTTLLEPLLPAVAVVLTLLVLSRVAGDNPLYRFSQYLFIGVSLGLALVVVYHQVLRPALFDVLLAANNPTLLGLRLVPLVLGLLLFTRIGGQRFSWLANIPLALLFGVGGALAVGGALVGTLGPQLLDTAARPIAAPPAAALGTLVLALGVVLVLASFYFAAPAGRPTRARQLSVAAGRGLLLLSFGYFFAGALTTYMSALIERLQFIVNWAQGII